MHLHLPLSLSDAMHLRRIVLFSCEHLGVRVVPEVLHTWVVDHGRLEQRREERLHGVRLFANPYSASCFAVQSFLDAQHRNGIQMLRSTGILLQKHKSSAVFCTQVSRRFSYSLPTTGVPTKGTKGTHLYTRTYRFHHSAKQAQSCTIATRTIDMLSLIHI